MRRGCLIGVVGTLGLCLIVCGLVYFVGIPRIRDSARDGVRDAISTQVAIQIPAEGGGNADPGSYTISASELQRQFLQNVNSDSVDDIVIRISETGFDFGFTTSGNQEAIYSGFPVAQNGQLVMTGMTTTNDGLDFIFPAEDLGAAIEEAVNNYLAANDLELDSLTLENGSITLETVAASK